MFKFNLFLLSLFFVGFFLLLFGQEIDDQVIFVDKIYYGVFYYLEIWFCESVLEDICYMKEFFMNVVCMVEFFWFKMEFREGEYDFEWLCSIMDELYEYGIFVIFGIFIVILFVWLWEKYLEIGQFDEDGCWKYYGVCKSYDYNNQVYQYYVVCIVFEMAKVFGSYLVFIGW